MAETGVIIRNFIADYLNVGTDTAPEWALMGRGFNSLDENPNAQIDTKAYINDASASSTIKGYQTQFPFNLDLIDAEKPVKALYDVGRNQKQGGAAEFDYIRVELFRDVDPPDDGVHPARKFRVAAEVTSTTGAGAEIVNVAGNLNNVGTFVDGTFDIADNTFTPTVTP